MAALLISYWQPHAELVLLGHEHAADLAAASNDSALHELWYTSVPHPDDM